MKYIVAGSRGFNNYEKLKEVLDKICLEEIVSGTAKGADTLGEKYALENDILLTAFPAKWDEYGRSAGFRRNAEMAQYGDALVAFWDGQSSGTKHMIDLALAKGMWIKVVRF